MKHVRNDVMPFCSECENQKVAAIDEIEIQNNNENKTKNNLEIKENRG